MNILFQQSNQRVFGTYPLKGTELSNAVAAAIEAGYRAFDTAQMYQNEADTGATLGSSGMARDELCVITKVHPDNYTPNRFMTSVEDSLKHLRLDVIDVLFLHWPPADGQIEAPLDLLQQAHARGLARSIGVSNFNAAMMARAAELTDVPLVANQIEFHPLLDQSRLLAASVETGIPLMSYSSVARGAVFKVPLFTELAESYGKTPAQIVLRWILQKGVVANTMSTKPANIRANFDVMDFTLSTIDMARIDALGATNYRIVTKAAVPWAPDWD